MNVPKLSAEAADGGRRMAPHLPPPVTAQLSLRRAIPLLECKTHARSTQEHNLEGNTPGRGL